MNMAFNNMSHFVSGSESGKMQCPVCGEMFKPASEHAYYIGSNRKNYCCSYTCMRNNEKNKTTVPVSHKRKHGTSVRVAETGEIFESISQFAKHLGVNYGLAYRALMNGYSCKGVSFRSSGRR